MKRNRIAVIVAATASLLAGLSSTASNAAPSPDTSLVSATLSVDHSDLTGAGLATMTVSVHLTDQAGVQPRTMDQSYRESITCPCAYLMVRDEAGYYTTASTQANDQRVLSLHLTSGDATDGVWSATTLVGAINAGRWLLRGLIAGTLQSPDGSQLSIYPVAYYLPWLRIDGDSLGATVDVTGRNWPIVTVDAPPAAVAEGTPYRFSGSVYFIDSRQPAAHLPLTVARDIFFPNPDEPARTVTTDANGRWTTTFPAPANAVSLGYGSDSQSPIANVVSTKQRYVLFKTAYWVVTVHASSSRAPATVSGAVLQHDVGRAVQLQKLVGRTWHNVRTFMLSQTSNRYSFRVTSAGTYRVHADAGSGVIRGYSKTIVLR